MEIGQKRMLFPATESPKGSKATSSCDQREALRSSPLLSGRLFRLPSWPLTSTISNLTNSRNLWLFAFAAAWAEHKNQPCFIGKSCIIHDSAGSGRGRKSRITAAVPVSGEAPLRKKADILHRSKT